MSEQPKCGDKMFSWICTRALGHSGHHSMSVDTDEVHAWTDAGDGIHVPHREPEPHTDPCWCEVCAHSHREPEKPDPEWTEAVANANAIDLARKLAAEPPCGAGPGEGCSICTCGPVSAQAEPSPSPEALQVARAMELCCGDCILTGHDDNDECDDCQELWSNTARALDAFAARARQDERTVSDGLMRVVAERAFRAGARGGNAAECVHDVLDSIGEIERNAIRARGGK